MYPNSPGFAANSDTSREAADRLTGKDELQGFILNYLQHSCIYYGSTVDEAKERCESHFERSFDRSTIAARFTELTEEGLIVLTAEKRLTPRRRRAGVYLHRDFAPVGSLERQARGSAKKLQEDLTKAQLRYDALVAALKPLGLVELVNGWHHDPSFARHPKELGVTLKTDCGTVYKITDLIRS